MGKRSGVVLGALMSVCVAGVVLAAESPVAVSPGSETGTVIGDACPTFSWGGVEGAEGYELVVYLLGDEVEEAEAVLRQRFAGSVDGWTPSLDRCLERGGRYAWSVGVVAGREASDWSSPTFFRVASGPSLLEFEEALEVVRTYLDDHAELVAATEPSRDVGDTPRREARAASQPSVHPAAAPTMLSVDGGVVAASFTGDGSTLTGVALQTADPSCADDSDFIYVDCGNGTVTDNRSGLTWLANANCWGLLDWHEAMEVVAGLSDLDTGFCTDHAVNPDQCDCGLSDGSSPGDWRLPSIAEWVAMVQDAVDFGCTEPALTADSPAVCYELCDDLFPELCSIKDVQNSEYWSSTHFLSNFEFVWSERLPTGSVNGRDKNDDKYVVPVRSEK